MSQMIDVAFDGMEFAENPEPRVPVVLLIDKSASMNGQPIEELNNGIKGTSNNRISTRYP